MDFSYPTTLAWPALWTFLLLWQYGIFIFLCYPAGGTYSSEIDHFSNDSAEALINNASTSWSDCDSESPLTRKITNVFERQADLSRVSLRPRMQLASCSFPRTRRRFGWSQRPNPHWDFGGEPMRTTMSSGRSVAQGRSEPVVSRLAGRNRSGRPPSAKQPLLSWQTLYHLLPLCRQAIPLQQPILAVFNPFDRR